MADQTIPVVHPTNDMVHHAKGEKIMWNVQYILLIEIKSKMKYFGLIRAQLTNPIV